MSQKPFWQSCVIFFTFWRWCQSLKTICSEQREPVRKILHKISVSFQQVSEQIWFWNLERRLKEETFKYFSSLLLSNHLKWSQQRIKSNLNTYPVWDYENVPLQTKPRMIVYFSRRLKGRFFNRWLAWWTTLKIMKPRPKNVLLLDGIINI